MVALGYVESPLRESERVSSDFLRYCADAIRPDDRSDTGELLHALIAFSQFRRNPSVFSEAEFEDLLDRLLTNSEDGRPRFGITRHGVRFLPVGQKESDGESHPYQTLAVLAELGVDKDRELFVGDKRFTIEDLLRDCEAMFDLNGEIEWSVIALVLYSPKRKYVENRYGERYTLDDIARRLLKRDPGLGPCLGCHVVDALMVLDRAAADGNVHLGAQTRIRIQQYIDRLLEFVPTIQREDGAVSADWGEALIRDKGYQDWRRESDPDYEVQLVVFPTKDNHLDWKIIATTHHLKWMMLRCETGRLDQAWVRKANRFLRDALKKLVNELKTTDQRKRARPAYCPMSHGLHVLSLLNCERTEADRNFSYAGK